MRRLLVSVFVVAAIASAALAAPEEKPATPAAGNKVDAGDKLICKRFLETGSLVKGVRTCKTRREWDRERENIRTGFTGGGACASPGGGCQ